MVFSCAERRKRRSSLAILTAAHCCLYCVAGWLDAARPSPWSPVAMLFPLSPPPPPSPPLHSTSSCPSLSPCPPDPARARLPVFISLFALGFRNFLFLDLEKHRGHKRFLLFTKYMKRGEESDRGVSKGKERLKTGLNIDNSAKVRGRGKSWSRDTRGRLKDSG